MSGAGTGAGYRSRGRVQVPRYGSQYRGTLFSSRAHCRTLSSVSRRNLILKFIRGLFAEPPPSDLEQPASLVHQQLVYFHMHNFAIQGPKRYADEAPVKTGEIPPQRRGMICFVNHAASCWWIHQVVYDKMLRAGFAGLRAWTTCASSSSSSGSVCPGAVQILPPGLGAVQVPMPDAGPEAVGQDEAPSPRLKAMLLCLAKATVSAAVARFERNAASGRTSARRLHFMRKCRDEALGLPICVRKKATVQGEEVTICSGTALTAAANQTDQDSGQVADDLSWRKIVDTWMSCEWLVRLACGKLLEAGFAALVAASSYRRSIDAVPVRSRFIDAVPGERPAMFCHQCHWVGVPYHETIIHCGNDRQHMHALSLYRDWDWQAQWNAVGRPRSWLPQWETDPLPGPWELTTQPEDPLPPWYRGGNMPPPRPATPPESDDVLRSLMAWCEESGSRVVPAECSGSGSSGFTASRLPFASRRFRRLPTLAEFKDPNF